MNRNGPEGVSPMFDSVEEIPCVISNRASFPLYTPLFIDFIHNRFFCFIDFLPLMASSGPGKPI